MLAGKLLPRLSSFSFKEKLRLKAFTEVCVGHLHPDHLHAPSSPVETNAQAGEAFLISVKETAHQRVFLGKNKALSHEV